MLKPPGIRLIIFLSTYLFTALLQGQNISELTERMRAIAPMIRSAPSDPERYAANERFSELLDEAIRQDSRMRHAWEELEGISILTSADQRFRVFTWFIPLMDGTYIYQGVIQSYHDRHKQYSAHWLQDQSDKITQPEQALLDANRWYGALYYELIPSSTSRNTYYTLLGWDGNDHLTRRKIVEVLTFRSNGDPVFGYFLFRKKYQKNRRIIFEYSARGSMTLRYDRQTYTERTRKKGKGVIEKKIHQEMIVFDRLMPMHPSMEGQPAFYVPETNIVDAFVWQDGRWQFYPNIDARNPAPRKRKTAPKTPELELFR